MMVPITNGKLEVRAKVRSAKPAPHPMAWSRRRIARTRRASERQRAKQKIGTHPVHDL